MKYSRYLVHYSTHYYKMDPESLTRTTDIVLESNSMRNCKATLLICFSIFMLLMLSYELSKHLLTLY